MDAVTDQTLLKRAQGGKALTLIIKGLDERDLVRAFDMLVGNARLRTAHRGGFLFVGEMKNTPSALLLDVETHHTAAELKRIYETQFPEPEFRVSVEDPHAPKE